MDAETPNRRLAQGLAGAAAAVLPGQVWTDATSLVFKLLCAAWLVLLGPVSVRCQDTVEELPQLLLIGDSISIGYTASLTESLQDVARVVRPLNEDGTPENAEGTRHGLQRLTAWLETFPASDVVVFNFGLHDMKWELVESQPLGDERESAVRERQTDPERYRTALEQIADSLLATEAKLLFVCTTPVPTGTGNPVRRPGDPLIYNGLAQRVMAARGIEVLDLWALAAEHPQWQRPKNVHFTDEGYRQLGEAVAVAVRRSLEDPVAARQTQQAASAGDAWEPALPDLQRAGRDARFNYLETNVPTYTLPDPVALGAQPLTASTEAQRWSTVREATDRKSVV